MDSATLGQYSGYIALLLSISAMVISAINHKKIRSECCGRVATASLSIGQTTPPGFEPKEKADKPVVVVD